MAENRKLAKHIAAVSDGKTWSLKIDGSEFPWYIDDGGVTTQIGNDGIPSVTITLIAEAVTTDHKLLLG